MQMQRRRQRHPRVVVSRRPDGVQERRHESPAEGFEARRLFGAGYQLGGEVPGGLRQGVFLRGEVCADDHVHDYA